MSCMVKNLVGYKRSFMKMWLSRSNHTSKMLRKSLTNIGKDSINNSMHFDTTCNILTHNKVAIICILFSLGLMRS